ncbi:MAG TPA: DUF4466 family protein [Chitinophagaceae bacterium]|nr:DUF4466 family protein [Chitinophagaceae bacterium]
MRPKYLYNACLLLSLFLVIAGCNDDRFSATPKPEFTVPDPKQVLQDDCIKRSLGPNIVGQDIEFAYAMAILPDKGKIASATVEASIAGGQGTFLENKSYYTDGSGNDIGIPIGDASVNKGATTEVAFTVDTSAATLRYYYVIPEAARGKSVNFTFTAKSSDGETVSRKMGPYTIAKMDIARNLMVKDSGACYISVADTAVYDSAAAVAHAANIDLVYLYRSLPNVNFNHALVSPAADPKYLPGISLPNGVKNDTRVRRTEDLQDYDLAHLQYGIYIDDVDFERIDLSGAPDYTINLKAESGLWVETADGKYKAYIYINSVDNTNKSAVISMKRYQLK